MGVVKGMVLSIGWIWIIFWCIWCTGWLVYNIIISDSVGIIIQGLIGSCWYTAAYLKPKHTDKSKAEDTNKVSN